MSEAKAARIGLEPLAFVRSWAVAGVPPDIMGIGPAGGAEAPREDGLSLARHRPRRDQRGVRQPVDLLHPRARPRPREDERQRRRDRDRPPARGTGAVLTCKILGEMKRRDAQARHRHHVHRRRDGLRLPARTPLSPPPSGCEHRARPRGPFPYPSPSARNAARRWRTDGRHALPDTATTSNRHGGDSLPRAR